MRLVDFLIFVSSFQLTVCIYFYPSTKVIYVTEGDDYTFGFYPYIDTMACNYSSNQRTYHLVQLVDRLSPGDDTITVLSGNGHNNIEANKYTPFCRITVRNASKDGPIRWRLTAVNHNGNSIDEETIQIVYLDKTPLANPYVKVYDGSDFMQFLKLKTSFTQCFLQIGQVLIDLLKHEIVSKEINVNHPTPQTLPQVEYYKEHDREKKKDVKQYENMVFPKIEYLGYNRCGFQFKSTSRLDLLFNTWTLVALGSDEKYYGNTFKVEVHSRAKDSRVRREAVVGNSFSLSCSNNDLERFCQIFDPQGELVSTSCTYNITIVKMRDFGTWKCLTANDMDVKGVATYVELVKFDTEFKRVNSWYTTDDQYTHLHCKMQHFTGITPIDSCQFISPTQQVVFVTAAFSTQRYDAFGTDFSRGLCTLRIENPLLDGEKGKWKCELSDLHQYFDGILNLESNSSEIVNKTQHVQVRQNYFFWLKFNGDRSYDYCYIKSPNGTILTNGEHFHPGRGECNLKIAKATTSDNGIWDCVLGQQDGSQIHIKTEVEVKNIYNTSRNVQVNEGAAFQLICNVEGLPFKYCVFISPTNEVFYLKQNYKSDSANYIGKGLLIGDCAIEIKEANHTHDGDWKCITKIGIHSKSQLIRSISVKVSDQFRTDMWFGKAGSCFMGVSIGLLVLLLITTVLIRKQRNCSDSEPDIHEVVNYSYGVR